MPYILPVMPALALLIAALPPQALRRDLSDHGRPDRRRGHWRLGAASLDWPSVIASSDRSAYFLPLARPLRADCVAARGVGSLRAGQVARRGATRAAVFLGAGWCLAWLLLIRAAALRRPRLLRRRSCGGAERGRPHRAHLQRRHLRSDPDFLFAANRHAGGVSWRAGLWIAQSARRRDCRCGGISAPLVARRLRPLR